MRKIEITKPEFDDFLFPALGNSSAKNEQELEVALRVVKKIKDVSVIQGRKPPLGVPIVDRQVPDRVLLGEKVELELEEDEHKLIVDRLKAFIPRITILAAEELYGFLERLIKSVGR